MYVRANRTKHGLKILVLILSFLLLLAGCEKELEDYGVFLGINRDEIYKLEGYKLVVIEPSEFTEEDITKLHQDGKTVYAYLNIGALEDYRPYYDRFKSLTLATYEDWPDESWIDTSSDTWKKFIAEDLGKKYVDMGFDGFFLDNADVYYHFQTEEIFKGLCTILKGLKAYGLPLLINGGDAFVSRCIEEDIALVLFDGVNQESVFTNPGHIKKSYERLEEATVYFKTYLSKVKAYGLSVYLLEYGADRNLAKEIKAYCLEQGFFFYNAPSLDLH